MTICDMWRQLVELFGHRDRLNVISLGGYWYTITGISYPAEPPEPAIITASISPAMQGDLSEFNTFLKASDVMSTDVVRFGAAL